MQSKLWLCSITFLLGLAWSMPAIAAEKIKIGLLTTLSGTGAPSGIDIRDGFLLGMKQRNNQFGSTSVELVMADDTQNVEVAKQIVEKFLHKDKVDFVTGPVFSNIVLSIVPETIKEKTYFISANAGPSQLAGEKCNPYFFSVSFQNDALHEVAGREMFVQGIKNVVTISPNYSAGKDAIVGFKRFYKSKITEEIYAKLGEVDFSAELQTIKQLKPQAVYFFLPGMSAAHFVKQFVAAGLSKDTQLYTSAFSADEDILKEMGSSILGAFNSSHWSHDLPLPHSRAFVQEFQKTYGRLPSVFAAQGYDAVALIDSAVRKLKGKIDDKNALKNALFEANFKSVRGDFKFNNNHFPIQDYYRRVVVKDAAGRITNKTLNLAFAKHGDAYARSCKMQWLTESVRN